MCLCPQMIILIINDLLSIYTKSLQSINKHMYIDKQWVQTAVCWAQVLIWPLVIHTYFSRSGCVSVNHPDVRRGNGHNMATKGMTSAVTNMDCNKEYDDFGETFLHFITNFEYVNIITSRVKTTEFSERTHCCWNWQISWLA